MLFGAHSIKLWQRRLGLGLTQSQIGERFGAADYYERLEGGGHQRVNPETLQRLTQALQCQVEDLAFENHSSAKSDTSTSPR